MAQEDRLLALDQGTSSTRALIFERSGALVDVVQRDFDGSYPADGWVEHDPSVLWQTSLEVMRAAIERAGGAQRIAAIGITNQRETTLLWDRATSEPVYPAIVWQDRRTHDECERMRAEGVEGMLQHRTGLLIDKAIRDLGYAPHSFDEGIALLASQMSG